MAIELMKLPYSEDALEPHISKETLSFHYGKHHAGYVTKLNTAIEGTDKAGKSLEEIVKSSEGGIFNNAAQIWNHNFYWLSMTPNSKGEPTGKLAEAINAKFGSTSDFKKAFQDKSATLFGSGWCWLVKKSDGSLDIQQTVNAATPITGSDKPLMVCDVWEHAYYIDYRNKRPDYLESFWKVINWDFADENFSS